MTQITFRNGIDNMQMSVLMGLFNSWNLNVEITDEKTPVNKKMSKADFARLSLSEKATYLDNSINKNVPPMTMEEIVQEVRDYRNGK